MVLKKKFITDFSYVFFSSSIGQVLRIVRNMFVAGLLGPEIFGTIQGLSIFLLYIPLIQFGYFQAANREIPQLIGKNDYEKINGIEFNGLIVVIVSSVLALAVYLVFYFWNSESFSLVTKICWLGFSITIFLQPLGQFYQVLYSAHDKFQELSRIKIIESVAFFLLLVLVIVFGYVGQLLSLAMSAAILLILMIREKPIDITINRFNIAIIRELIVKGYPILLSALTFNIFFTIDRIFIIGMRGAEEYGYYAIGASIFQIVIFVPESIRQISYRYFNIEYGRQGNSSKLKNGFWYSFLSVCIVMWTLTVIIYNIVPSMIQLLLPEYLPSISIVKVFAMTMAFAAPGMMLSTALYSVHLEKKVLGIYVMAIMIFIIGIVFFIQYEMPTYTVALIISLSHAVSSLMMFSLVTKQPEYQLTKNMLKVVIGALSGLMLIAISFTVGVGEAIAGDNVFVQLLSMVLYLVIVASFLFGLYKRYRNMNDHVFTGNSEEL